MQKTLKYALILLMLLVLAVLAPYSSGNLTADEFVYDSKEKRDPFVPLVSKSGILVGNWWKADSVDDITLEGIAWDPDGGSFAIINGTIVKEGDSVSGVKVVEITKTGVKLLRRGKEVVINLITEEGG